MRVLIVVGILLGAVNFACAADMPGPAPYYPPPAPPPPAPYNWTGIYGGLNAGGGFASAKDTGTITGGDLGGVSASGTGSATGALGGGQIGFNYQVNSLVLGMEGDFDYSSLSSTSTASILSETSKIQWLATIRGRAGFAIDRIMIYGTGGAAFVPVSDSITASGYGTVFNASSTNIGWTIGAGVEGAFAQNWTAKIEYLYVQSNFSLSGPIAVAGGTLSYTGTISENVIRAGINFKYP